LSSNPWVEDGLAPHPVEAGHGVGVGVGEDVPDVERSRDRGRRVSMEYTCGRGAVRSKV